MGCYMSSYRHTIASLPSFIFGENFPSAPSTLFSEDHWSTLRDVLHSSAEEIIGFVKRKHRDWFDENHPSIRDLLSRLHHAHIQYVMDKSSQSKKTFYLCLKREAQTTLRAMINRWLKDRADELQLAYDRKDFKAFYAGLKAAYGPSILGSMPIYAADGQTLIKDQIGILNCWAEHFNSILNRVSTISDEAIDLLPQRPIREELDEAPTEAETTKAVRQLSSRKAAGADELPVRVSLAWHHRYAILRKTSSGKVCRAKHGALHCLC